ncbi:MAG: hypothetical protein QOD00_2810 [Blastocatellia bacterium]|jgi:hypothetical protein|nr:hypothetical protein [Blastocatellia bacterium]
MAVTGSFLSSTLQTTASICALVALTVCLTQAARAQDQQQQLPPQAPPPMKFIPRDDWTRLNGQRGAGDRTRASIELAEAHLGRALELTSAGQFDGAAREMGCYQALFENALKYLSEMDQSRGKVRDLYKRLELALREHAPRIETIRRTTPVEYSVHIRAILDYTKDARAHALESFYGNTVLREQPMPASSKSYDNKARNPASQSPTSPDKQP